MGNAEKEALCVPNFMEVQMGCTVNESAALIVNQDLGQKSGTNTSNLDRASDQMEQILKEVCEDKSQGMVTEQAGGHDTARGKESDSNKMCGGEMENIGRAGLIGPDLAKAQIRKPKWKKRARAIISSEEANSNNFQVGLRGKRLLQYEGDAGFAEEAGNRLKKARSSGEVITHDSVSAAAVEQPCRSQ